MVPYQYIIVCGLGLAMMSTIFDDIEKLAYQLFLEHGVPLYWSFGFDNGKRRYGICNYVKKEIRVSRYYVTSSQVTLDDVKNLILHEIAHVLAGWGASHGPKWKKICKRIGCDGNTCIKSIFIPTGHWLQCQYCKCSYRKQYFRKIKLTKRKHSCRICKRLLVFTQI